MRREGTGLLYVPVESAAVAAKKIFEKGSRSKIIKLNHYPACKRVQAAARICHLHPSPLRQLADGAVGEKSARTPVLVQNLRAVEAREGEGR